MRRAVWAFLGLVAFVGAVSSCGWAVERELAGARLGDTMLQLLDKPGFGEPKFIGPLGATSAASAEQQTARAAGAGRSGPTGPAGRGGGMAAGGMRGGRGGMGRGGMRGGRGGMGRGGMRGGMGGGGMRGGMRGGRGAAGGGVRRAAGGAAVSQRGMYWYYSPARGIVLVLSLDLEGKVTAVTLSGNAPYLKGRTTRGIGLTTGYMEIIAKYGYPDQSVVSGPMQELTYVDHGVRFTLDSMRVQEIVIGAHIGAAIEAAPAVTPEAAPPPAGMSIEELRGYL